MYLGLLDSTMLSHNPSKLLIVHVPRNVTYVDSPCGLRRRVGRDSFGNSKKPLRFSLTGGDNQKTGCEFRKALKWGRIGELEREFWWGLMGFHGMEERLGG